MATDRNKIACELSDAELREFLALCYETPDLTLAKLKELAAAQGVECSLMSVRNFKQTTYARYLEKLDRAAAMAKQVAALTAGDEGRTLADAASGLLGQQVFDFLMEADLDMAGPDGMEAAGRLALILKRLRSTDQAQKALELRLAEYERQEAERAEQKRKFEQALAKEQEGGGLSAEAMGRIEKQLGML